MPKKLILKDFELEEISGVDRPAQAPALMSIIKRKTKEPDMSAEELKKLQKQVSDLSDALTFAKGMASLNDTEKQFAAGMDEKEQKSFSEMSSDERKSRMEMAKQAQETMEINGTLINKAAVGADMFEVLKSQQAQIQKQEAETKIARELAIQATFVKRASDEYSHVPGSADQIGALLRETADISKGSKDTLEAVLTALEKSNAASFKPQGHSGGKDEGESAIEKLDKLAKDHSEKHNVDYATAYSTVIEKNAALYAESLN
jgi:hypothetical protein